MERLYMKSKDQAQVAVEGLYKDLERRIISSPAGQCPVDMAAAFLRMCHAQSCGKCVPCRVGLGQLQIMLEDILSMDANLDLKILDRLERTAKAIQVASDCAIGVEAAAWYFAGWQDSERTMSPISSITAAPTTFSTTGSLCLAEADVLRASTYRATLPWYTRADTTML